VVNDSAFDNVTSLRFGFRWHNDASSVPSSVSFAIDDIEIVGTYDSISNPVTITVTDVFPDTICQNAILFVFWQLSDSLCDGFYEVELSDAGGGFFNPVSLGVFQITNFQVAGAVAVIIPPTTFPGGCYRVRINRINPAPPLYGIPSPCIVVQSCPNTISTLQPPVSMDTNAVCIGSVIDIPFYSTGVFVFNQYIAELSDSSGSFAAPTFIGSLTSNTAFDPSLGSQPGNVGGLVPNVPPGCNYYVRIRSTGPVTIGSPWGPFCIGQCDITTNKKQDLQFCITSTTGDSSIIYVDVHTFDSVATYLPGNLFELQLLDSKTLSFVNQGALGSWPGTASDSFMVTVPPLPALLALGIAPGSYYSRIVATNSSVPDNSLGSMIHLSIGAPNDFPLQITSNDTLFCPGDIGSFFVNPYNFNSQYQWWCNGINNGVPFFWDYYPLFVQYGGPGTLLVSAREWNYGCPGPGSDTAKVVVIQPPSVLIVGPAIACKGDTVHYKVTFVANTYYEWSSNDGIITDTANNEIDIVFDTLGSVQVQIFGLNKCGSDTGFKNITVYDKPVANAGTDSSICAGDTITLSSPAGTGYSYSWTSSGGPVGTGIPISVSPPGTTDYYLLVNVVPGNCKSYDTVTVNVQFPLNNVNFNDSACSGETVLLDPGVAGTSYIWSNGATTSQINVSTSGIYSVGINVAGELCQRTDSFFVYPRSAMVVSHSDSLCPGDTITLDPGFSGGTYQWNDGSTAQQLNATSAGGYSVAIAVTGNPCYRTDTFNLVMATPGLNNYTDSLCEDSSLVLNASIAGGNYLWSTGASTMQIAIGDTGIYTVITYAPSVFCYLTDSFVVYKGECPPPEEVSFVLPNVFTPNNDGFNDGYSAITKGDYDDFLIQIFNRWGKLMFESTDTAFEWDGRNQDGNDCSDGVYYYVAKTAHKGVNTEYKGTVTLLRNK
jgi:gliding motility-associated-like protein